MVNQRQLQAQQQAFEQRAQQLNQIAANVGGPAPQMPIPPPIIPQNQPQPPQQPSPNAGGRPQPNDTPQQPPPPQFNMRQRLIDDQALREGVGAPRAQLQFGQLGGVPPSPYGGRG